LLSKREREQCTNHVYLVVVDCTPCKCPGSFHLSQHSPLVFTRLITASVTPTSHSALPQQVKLRRE